MYYRRSLMKVKKPNIQNSKKKSVSPYILIFQKIHIPYMKLLLVLYNNCIVQNPLIIKEK